MLKLIDFVIIAVNIIMAAYYLSELRQVRRREKELLDMMETWEACRNAEIKALAVFPVSGGEWWGITDEQKSNSNALIEMWRN